MNRFTFRFVPIAILVISIIIVALGSFFSYPIYKHDKQLNNLFMAFKMLKHPGKSHEILEFKKLGILSGNGNHCDFICGKIMESSLSHNAIIDFYKNIRIPSIDKFDYCDVELLFYDNGFLNKNDVIPLNYRKLSNFISPIKIEKTYYIVYVFDMGYPSEYDSRCY